MQGCQPIYANDYFTTRTVSPVKFISFVVLEICCQDTSWLLPACFKTVDLEKPLEVSPLFASSTRPFRPGLKWCLLCRWLWYGWLKNAKQTTLQEEINRVK